MVAATAAVRRRGPARLLPGIGWMTVLVAATVGLLVSPARAAAQPDGPDPACAQAPMLPICTDTPAESDPATPPGSAEAPTARPAAPDAPDAPDAACAQRPTLPLCSPAAPEPPGDVPGLVRPPIDGVPGAGLLPDGASSVMPGLLGEGGADYSRFDLGYDPGSAMDAVSGDSAEDWFFGMLTRLAWTVHTWLVSINSWMLEQAIQFRVGELMLEPVDEIASVWERLVVDQLGLAGFALVCAFFVGGMLMIRGRLTGGLVEIGMSLLAGALFVLMLAAPGAALLGDDGLAGQARQFSLEAASVTLSLDNSTTARGSADLADPLVQGLGYALIASPHMILNWGEALDDPDEPRPGCLATYRQLIETGPHGTDDAPRDQMTDAGCEDLAEFNAAATPDRLVATMVVGFGTLVLLVLLFVLTLTLMLAQLVLAAMVIAVPIVYVSANAPGAGRNLLWWWVMTVLGAVFTTVGALVGLAVFIRLIIAVFQASNDFALMLRMLLFDLVVLLGFLFFRKIRRGAGRAAEALTRRMAHGANAAAQGGGASIAPWVAGGAGLATGMGLRHAVYEGRREWRTVANPAHRARIRAERSAPGRWAKTQTSKARGKVRALRRDATHNVTAAARTHAGQVSAAASTRLAAAGNTARAGARERADQLHHWLAPQLPTFSTRPAENPGWRTPGGLDRPRGSRLRPTPAATPAAGPTGPGPRPRPQPPASVADRHRLADRLTAARTASPNARLRLHDTPAADRELSRSAGYRTPSGSRSPPDSAARRDRLRARLRGGDGPGPPGGRR